MSNFHTLAYVKSIFGDKVAETTSVFVVMDYGKYRPNISFVLAKDFSGNPLEFRQDQATRHLVAGFGLDFGTGEGAVSVLFGDFWLSSRQKPHFSPKSPQEASHVLVRAEWGAGRGGSRTRGRYEAPVGAAEYFRRASSNGGGAGSDYYVLPFGFYHVVRDEELDGANEVVAPDYAARAAQLREAFARHDTAEAAEAAAKAKAKANAEEASRLARAGFAARFEALQARIEVLRATNPERTYVEPVLGEETFRFGWGQKLYTEQNVTAAERSVTQSEEALVKRLARAAMIPRLEAFAPRVENLGLSLEFGDEKASWSDGYYGSGFDYTSEGLAAFEADLVRREEVAAKKAAAQAAANAKASAEAEAAALGLPSGVNIWRRMGGANNRGNGWVLHPDGSQRPADTNPSQGDLVWNQVLPGELVLRYQQSSRYDIAHCDVVYRPDEVTAAQLAVVKQLEEELGASENAFGLDEQLGHLLERRIAAIEEAMADLPESLRPEGDWEYQVLSSANGIPVGDDPTSWAVNANDAPFEERCSGREAQAVLSVAAADGELVVLLYYKWGGWNTNLVWRELDETPAHSSGDAGEEPVVEENMELALSQLQEKFGK